MANQVQMTVNGQPVDLNPFVQDVLAGVLQGFVAALDRVPQPVQRIEVAVRVEPK